MTKMIFEKEETRNLLMMLQSQDVENHIVAFESLKNVDFDKYIGELLVLFKFGDHTFESWDTHCKKIAQKLEIILRNSYFISAPKTLELITQNNGSKNSIELFLELFTKTLLKVLEDVGFSKDKFDLNITLK